MQEICFRIIECRRYGQIMRTMQLCCLAGSCTIRGNSQLDISCRVVHKDSISKVENCGLSVKVIISDQGSNNRNMFETVIGITEQEPHFMHNGHKVYVLYDHPHLVKNVRNNLKKHGFNVDGNLVHWILDCLSEWQLN